MRDAACQPGAKYLHRLYEYDENNDGGDHGIGLGSGEDWAEVALVGEVLDGAIGPDQGLAFLNHLAGLSRMSPAAEFKLADGTKLDFSAEMKKLFADPRTFGAPLENLPRNVQQAANAVLLHYTSREMLSAYWEISNPSPSADSIDALLKETDQKVVDRFTKRKDPVSNPS